MIVRPVPNDRDAPATDGIASAAEAYGFVGWVVSTAFYGAGSGRAGQADQADSVWRVCDGAVPVSGRTNDEG